MAIGAASRTTKSERRANLADAIGMVDQSGIVEEIESSPIALARNPRGAGAKARLTPYPLRTSLCVWQEIALSGNVMAFVNIGRRLLFEYDAAELELLGPGFFRDEERIAQMRAVSHLDPSGKPVLRENEKAGFRMYCSEYQRHWSIFTRQLEALNDNPKKASRAWPGADIEKARRTADLAPRTALREHVANRIVAASVEYKNGLLFPHLQPTDLHQGVLQDHRGDIAVDLTPVDVNISRHRGDQSKEQRTFSRNQMVTYFPKNRRMKWPGVVGLTLGVAVGRAGGPRTPNVALSMALSQAKAAHREAAIVCLDAIEQAGHRPPRVGRERQLFIADIAYQDLVGLNADYLIPNDWSPVFKFAKTENVIQELRAIDPDTKESRSVGNLFRGIPMCPLAEVEALRARDTFDAPEPDVVDGEPVYDRGTLELYERDSAWFDARRAGPHGNPQRRAKRRPGRPSEAEKSAAVELETVIRMRCPALNGQIRCALRKDAESWKNLDLDIGDSPPRERTPLCKQGTVTVRLTDLQAKHIQPFLVGSWDHHDNYQSSRAYNEAFHSQLIAPNVGGLRRGQITTFKNAPFTISVAMLVAAANIRAIDRWKQNLDADGKSPDVASTRRRRLRAATLKQRRAA